MKLIFKVLTVMLAAAMTLTMPAFAQTFYPGTTPVTFINAVPTAASFTATGTKVFSLSGMNTVSVRLSSNTFTSMTAAIEGSNDPVSTSEASSTWAQLRLYPVGGGSSLVYITSGSGVWKGNVAGLTKIRVNVSALSATSVTFQLATNAGEELMVQSAFSMGNVSAAVATATTTQVVAAPTAGSILLHAIIIGKSTASTGAVNVIYGTGSNCGTGTTTLVALGAATLPIGVIPLDIPIPAAKALCLSTDAATTAAYAVTQ